MFVSNKKCFFGVIVLTIFFSNFSLLGMQRRFDEAKAKREAKERYLDNLFDQLGDYNAGSALVEAGSSFVGVIKFFKCKLFKCMDTKRAFYKKKDQ